MNTPHKSSEPTAPVVIAGPCVAESYELLKEVCEFLLSLKKRLGFKLIFKASFDKANRTSIDSYRGPGAEETLKWFQKLKAEYDVSVLTDVHECAQVAQVAKVCDVLQIPAFLCRQTDLLVAAVETGRHVNIKKGQFLSPEATVHIVKKAEHVKSQKKLSSEIWLTERGASFGYNNLIVDMRSFPIMTKSKPSRVIFDITHSLQMPSTGGKQGEVTGGQREFAPILARAATATGYLDGYFLEVHPNPQKAKSDASTVLSFNQTEVLLSQVIPLWQTMQTMKDQDTHFHDSSR